MDDPAAFGEAAMTTVEAIERAAGLLAAARLAQRRLARLPEDCQPPDEAAAYRVQDALHARLGAAGQGALAGHKIGCTTAVMQQFLGIANPCAGGVFAPTVQHRAGSFAHADFLHAGVECEIAVRLAQPLPAAGAPYEEAGVAAAVGACMAAIEVVDDRYEDYRSLDTPTLIADDFFNAGCVSGDPVERWHEVDLAALEGSMTINGSAVGRGRGGDILGHPLRALAWLANALAARSRALQPGEFVLLGSVVQTRWVEPGDLVEIEIAGLGRASGAFT
jgi:2-oxo-3-hexenedioate decarboxylase/2-keto-4-pentenoate hydratase